MRELHIDKALKVANLNSSKEPRQPLRVLRYTPGCAKELLNRTDRFAANAGCRITEVDAEHAVAEMLVTAEHLNGGHVCQGGALFTLADLAIAALMNYQGQLTFGISNSIMFVSSAKEGDLLRAEAVSVCNHHKIPSVEVRVTNQEGRLVCHVTGMGYRKSISIPE